jgi:hypothetical protein
MDRAYGDEVSLTDLSRLDGWYTRVRYRAIARQHRAVFLQTVSESAGPFGDVQRHVMAAADEVPEALRVDLPEEVLAGLSGVDDDEWRAFLLRNQKELVRWWNGGNLKHFRSIAKSIGELVTPTKSVSPFGLYTALPSLLPVGATMAGEIVKSPGTTLFGSMATIATVGTSFSLNAVLNSPRRRVQRRIVDAVKQVAST